MSEQKIELEMTSEHSEPQFANNVQIYPPLTKEVTIEFNKIDVKKSWKTADNGINKIFLTPVVSLQLSQDSTIELLRLLAKLYNVELAEKKPEQMNIQPPEEVNQEIEQPIIEEVKQVEPVVEQ